MWNAVVWLAQRQESSSQGGRLAFTTHTGSTSHIIQSNLKCIQRSYAKLLLIDLSTSQISYADENLSRLRSIPLALAMGCRVPRVSALYGIMSMSEPENGMLLTPRQVYRR